MSYFYTHWKNLIIFILLLFVCLLVYGRILNFYLWADDIYLYWVSKFHPGNYTIYYGHPSTVFEFFIIYNLFGINPFVANSIGLLLRVLAAFAGYLFISKLTNSKLAGLIFSVLFVTSYIGYETTTWESAHNVYIDLILSTLTAYWFLRYLTSKTKGDLVLVLILLTASLLSDPGRDFPLIGMLILILLVWEYIKVNKNIFVIVRSKEFKTIVIGLLITVGIFIIWYLLFGFYFSGGFGRPHKRIPLETLEYFFGSIANLVYDPIIKTPQRSEYGLTNIGAAYIAASIALPVFWIFVVHKLIKTRSKWWASVVILICWMFAFYFPSWINYPRSYVAAVHRYSTMSGFGLVGILSIGITLLSKKNKILAASLFILILVVNIYTVNYYLGIEEVYRNQKSLEKAWSQMSKSISNSEQKSLIYIQAKKPFATLGVVSSGPGFLSFSRNQESALYFKYTANIDRIANELCHQGITNPQLLKAKQMTLAFHGFAVNENGKVTDITKESIKALETILGEKNACMSLRNKYGDNFKPY